MRIAIFVLGLIGCTIATCGPARAASPADRALSSLCPRGDITPEIVESEARRNLLHPAMLTALIAHESRCRSNARSGRGDFGAAQVRVGGSAARGATAVELLDQSTNLRLAAAHLARCLTLCGGFSGLSVYSGHKRCRSTRYSRAVLALFWSTFGGK